MIRISTILLLGCICLVCFVSFTEASLIGIDFGSEWIKVSLVKPGKGLEIVLNKESKRKTTNAIAFYDGERFFGDEALNILVKKPQQVVLHSNLFVDEFSKVQEYVKREYFSYKLSEDPDRKTVRFTIADGSYKFDLTAEEVLAMILAQMTEYAEHHAGGNEKIRDCVITVPPFFNQYQRQALIDAAEIAGLNVLSLMTTHTAFALKYAIDHKFEENHERPHNLLLYDMGASSTTVSVVSFQSVTVSSGGKNKTTETLEVKALAYDPTLGGSAFDTRIVDLGVKEVNKRLKGENIRDSPRAMAKLRRQATRTKEILSANSDTIYGVEAVTDEFDLKMPLSRAAFEEASADLFDRAVLPLKEALLKSGLKAEELDSVTIVGGATRIPKLQTIITEAIGRALDKNLNGDEAGALGAGFYGASLSTAFKTRKINVQDISPFGFGVEVGRGSSSPSNKPPPRSVVFPAWSKFPSKKQLSFNRKEDFDITVFFAPEGADENTLNHQLGKYRIEGVEKALEFNETAVPKVAVTFGVTRSGMVAIERAEATTDQVVVVEVPKKEAKKADEPAEPSEEDFQDANDCEGEGCDEVPEAFEDAPKATTAPPTPDTDTTVEKELKQKTYVRRVALTPEWETAGTASLTKTARSQSVTRLAEFKQRDLARKELADSINQLETFLYNTRELIELDEDIQAVTSQEQRDQVLEAIRAGENWMFEDGMGAPAAEYNTKYTELRALLDPIITRKREMDLRPKAVALGQDMIKALRNMSSHWTNESHPQISEEDKAEFNKLIDEYEGWLNGKVKEQGALASHNTPAFLSADVESRAKPVQDKAMSLSRKPRPPKPRAPKKTKASETSAGASGDDSQQRANENVVPEDETNTQTPQHDDSEL